METEQIKQILDDAPDGANYVVKGAFQWNYIDWRDKESYPNLWDEQHCSWELFDEFKLDLIAYDDVRSISDLREMLQLRTLLEQVTRAADVVLAHPAEPAYRKNLDYKVADVRGVL